MPDTNERLQYLRDQLNAYNRLYHQSDQPQVSDDEYDRLFAEFQQLEAQRPEFQNPDSPTNRVGAPPSATFRLATHPQPMLSLANARDEQDFHDWLKRINPQGQPLPPHVEPKIDGLALRIEYHQGRLTQAVTRGDGTTGEDGTANILSIAELPRRPPTHSPGRRDHQQRLAA